MYSLRQLRKLVDNPKLGLIELNRLYHRRLHRWEYNEHGFDIFDQDWDILVILDACRYDMFTKESELPGTTRKVHSRGTSTIEFLRGNSNGRELLDTVYITANPQLHKHRGQINTTFYAEKHIWKDGGWDEEIGTVLPETTTEYALDVANRYPNKRIIVHYLQPHQPFINKKTALDTRKIAQAADGALDFWNQVISQTITLPRDELWDAYAQNLNAALPSVRELFESLDGKTVVTADHGELIRERVSPFPVLLTGHPQGIYVPSLVEVPWHVHESTSRRTVEAGMPEETTHTIDDASVKERLEDLGYR